MGPTRAAGCAAHCTRADARLRLSSSSLKLRHSTLSITANLYSHLTQKAAHQAVDTADQT
ncbi:hypothetical protein JGS39_13310 [Streptomyces sp. P01-B04]|uniref:hypothetical protein n=1 Tax=Streptomyces poriferorum TaxID=2798799 RepID=UPI001C5EA317|nr:hypothetical protein [Streptomyces poriferorum]MBW5249967.1 hypothetical protein [Streptomyces poriferorum]MBW5257138.1 hypothetical protein [Streptomyces poriferorum]